MRIRQPWSRLILIFLILGLILNRAGLLALTGMMVSVIGIAWLWNRYSLHGVKYQRRLHYSRGFPGESVECNFLIENEKFLPLGWLETSDTWPSAVAPDEGAQFISAHDPDRGALWMNFTMRGFHRVNRKLDLRLRKRGVYNLGPVSYSSGDPFGFFESRLREKQRQKVVIFPELIPTEELGLKPDDPFGLTKTKRRLFEDASRPIGVRDYRPSDGFRHIHWPATARTGELQTRVFQPISGLDLVICLNVTTIEPHWRGVRFGLLEELLKASASIATQTFEKGFRVGLISNGGMAYGGKTFRVPPGRSPNHLPYILEALASLTPAVSGPFDQFLLREAPRLEYGSTIIIVTGVMTSSLKEAIVKLRVRRRKIHMVCLAEDEPTDLHGVEVIHRPYLEEETER